MSWFKKLWGNRRPVAATQVTKVETSAHKGHLTEFASSRVEVEAFIEPPTTINTMTLLLVARDGEWTRRPVPDEKSARSFAREARIPIFDVNQSGYPSAMREYNARQKRAQEERRRNS